MNGTKIAQMVYRVLALNLYAGRHKMDSLQIPLSYGIHNKGAFFFFGLHHCVDVFVGMRVCVCACMCVSMR